MGHKLTKANLLEMITKKNGCTKKQTSDIFDALLEILKSTLTLRSLPPAVRREVTFECSGKLRDRVNGR
jgi:hypothetical protein